MKNITISKNIKMTEGFSLIVSLFICIAEISIAHPLAYSISLTLTLQYTIMDFRQFSQVQIKAVLVGKLSINFKIGTLNVPITRPRSLHFSHVLGVRVSSEHISLESNLE